MSEYELPDPNVYKRFKEAIGEDETPPKPAPRPEPLIKNQRDILQELKLRADRYQYEKIKLEKMEMLQEETVEKPQPEVLDRRRSLAIAYAINKGKENVLPKYDVY